MKTLFSSLALALVLVAAVPAGAQVLPFEAEVDCDGIFGGGESVPFLLEFENRTFEQKNLDMSLVISIPGLGDRMIIQRVVSLAPNQDRFINRLFHLPVNAPQGNYVLTITASDGVDSTFDTCSFNVVS